MAGQVGVSWRKDGVWRNTRGGSEAAKWLTNDELDSVKWLPADLEVVCRRLCLGTKCQSVMNKGEGVDGMLTLLKEKG